MAITLQEMKVGMSDKVSKQVVDTFIRKSEILELIPFDNAVSAEGGSTLTYGYTQTKTPSTASFRALNTEYEPNQATLENKHVDLKIFGGSFEMDRVLNQANGKYNNMAFQMRQKIAGAVSTFHDGMINGDSTSNNDEFDGLDKMLVGTNTEFNTDAFLDLSTMAKIKENADEFYEELLTLINKTNAQALLVNEMMKTKIQTVARILGFKTESEKAFGRTISSIGENGVRIIDLGNIYKKADSTVTGNPIVGLKTRNITSSDTKGLTDIYAVKFDVNEGFHGVTLTGNAGIHQYLPNMKESGAVKKGEVEMVGAVALKNTQSAGVLRNIKIV